MQVIFPSNFEQKIGFDKIRQNLKDNCLSSIGTDYVEAISFMNQIEEIDLQTGLTEEFSPHYPRTRQLPYHFLLRYA
jgi:DNA mismatch repair protein MutS2